MTGKIAVTGANGFVGAALLDELAKAGLPARAFVREPSTVPRLPRTCVTSLLDRTGWSAALQDCRAVIHCAARVHVTREYAKDPLTDFRKINVDLTLDLARQAAEVGLKRFVYVSTIGVNGGYTDASPFTEHDDPHPQTPYAVSKWEAEQGLIKLSAETGMATVIVRPPLVYGAGAPGNFGFLVAMLRRGWPLPLGAVTRNRRSYVALPNLVDLLLKVSDHPAAANQVFLVSDGEDLSTADLLRRLGQALGRPARLLPVPVGMLKLGATLVGRPDLYQRLCGSLQVDIGKTRQLLSWTPVLTVDEGLRRAAVSTSSAWPSMTRMPSDDGASISPAYTGSHGCEAVEACDLVSSEALAKEDPLRRVPPKSTKRPRL